MRYRLLFIALGAVVLLAQFAPVVRSNPAVETEMPTSDPVRAILRRACYDCHSNETRWPWYAYIAPVSWLVTSDVSEAREKMNFSTWNRYSEKKQGRRYTQIDEEIEEQAMPPWEYLLMHPAARLSPTDKRILQDWARSHAPPESAPDK